MAVFVRVFVKEVRALRKKTASDFGFQEAPKLGRRTDCIEAFPLPQSVPITREGDAPSLFAPLLELVLAF